VGRPAQHDEMDHAIYTLEHIPVRIFWKASSTLLASRAEVSMKERWFSPVEFQHCQLWVWCRRRPAGEQEATLAQVAY